MATRIFIDQENGDAASALLSKDRVKLSSAGKLLVRSHQGKVFGSVSGQKTSRKALGNVNKQVTNKKTLHPLKEGKVKNLAPAAKKVSVSETVKPNKQHYPEIEKFDPYNPADFETFDVPEKHKLSHLSLAGVGLMVNVNDATKSDTLLSLDPVPMEIPKFSWEADVADGLSCFLDTLEEISVDMPPMLQC